MASNIQIHLYVCLIVFFAGFAQGLSGFGAMLLSLPLLAVLLDIKTVVPLVALLIVPIAIILLVQLRRHMDWKRIAPLFLGAVPGIPLGVLALKKLDRGLIQCIIGAILICYAIYGLALGKAIRDMRKGWGVVFGFVSGCLGGAVSASGPAVIVYTSLQSWGKDKIKVTLQGFFLVSGMIVVVFHAVNGLTTLTVLRHFLVSLPMLVLGTYVGSYFYGKIREEGYRKVMMMLLGLLGVLMISRTYMGG